MGPACLVSFVQPGNFASTPLPIKVIADSGLPLGQTHCFFAAETSQTCCRTRQTVLNDSRIQFVIFEPVATMMIILLELSCLQMLLGEKVMSQKKIANKI
jgi:hypothetical protein